MPTLVAQNVRAAAGVGWGGVLPGLLPAANETMLQP